MGCSRISIYYSVKKKIAKGQGKRLNTLHCPDNMTLEEWQVALRRQAAERENLIVRAAKDAPSGYFTVGNPTTKREYSVVYRGSNNEWNYCSCPDFHTNQLGTCKHIEAVNIADGGRYARRRYALPDRTSIYLDYHGERCVKIRTKATAEPALKLLKREWFDWRGRLKADAYDNFEVFVDKAKKLDPDLKITDDALAFIIEQRERKYRNNIADSNLDLADSILRVPLYPYQKAGVEFAFRQGRVLIADEMGLGKTIQAIGAAVLLQKHGLVGSVMIVCPTSLKYQWKSEIAKFTGATSCVVEGGLHARIDTLANDDSFFKIISYQSLTNCVNYGLPGMPDLIIYDEVQRLKNWDTKMAKAMRKLSSNYVVALSGTPLENRLTELYSVMQLVNQYVLGPYWKFVDFTTDTDSTGRVVGYRNLNVIGEQLKGSLIRRLKKDVALQMPPRSDKNLFVPVTKEQMAIHDDAKWQVGILLNRWRRMGFLPEKDRTRLMLLLSKMRMAADSTFILDQASRYDTKIDEALNIIEEIIENGPEKIVIFSQWERMQRVMAGELEAQGIGFRFLHGGVPSAKRGDLINHFLSNPDCRVFLSTDAGSTGLNLQAASVVINFDLPWNPAVLEQRIARVFRLGQQRHVQVINMISVGTIEEQMLNTLAFKTGLFEGVLDGGDDAIVLSDKKFERIAELVDNTLDFNEDNTKPEAKNDIAPESDEELAPIENVSDEEIDYVEPEADTETETKTSAESTGTDKTDDTVSLVSESIGILGKLASALATPESRQKLVDSIVKTDPSTGQTSISIPVADKESVSSIITLAANLLSKLS